MIIRSEDLAYWFLRLNGFLTIQNFVVHPDEGRDQRTDVDILGVRFPHRKELLNNPMEDYSPLTNNKKSLVVFCEVKTGTCSLNGPWTTPGKKNMQRVLKALGTHPNKSISKIAAMLYKHGKYRDRKSEISLLCIGKSNNPALKKTFPKVNQILFKDILYFIFHRFSNYEIQKSGHPQWCKSGEKLWKHFKVSSNAEMFIESIEITDNIREE